MSHAVTVDISDAIATITLNRPASYNALTPEDYDDIAEALRVIDRRDDVLITLWQATGKFFCAGTNVSGSKYKDGKTARELFLNNVARSNTDLTYTLSTHSKILVAALNGPVIGIAAAFLGQFDFVYALPHVWLAIPFTYLGLVAEGGSSVTFVNKLGLSRANEVLLWGKKLTAQDLEASHFVTKVFPEQDVPSFHASLRAHLLEELRGLDPKALLTVKALIRTGLREKNAPEAVNLRESYAQADQLLSGVPRKRFMQLSAREIRHKL